MALIAKKYYGELVDLHHYGHIVVTDETGKILWKLGDPYRMTYSRSSAKPMQAVVLVESGALDSVVEYTGRELGWNARCEVYKKLRSNQHRP